MSVNVKEPLLNSSGFSSPRQTPDPIYSRDGPKRTRRLRPDSARQIKMFLHGGESSIVTEQGDYNIHRMVPRFVKYYLNWTRDTFPSIVRLSWFSLMTLFISMKLVTIAFFALLMKLMDGDHSRECVTNANTYSDFFYFVVHTIFTIGYGSMSPVCHWSNMMVTIISFFGMFQTATFTGIFFAKFSMDPRRNYACAFTTKLVGIPPSVIDGENPDESVRFNFRLVNVFHRRYFKVSCRMFLIEHRLNPVTEHWLPPFVEELQYFDTSSPLEFMSLPVEVCAYVPFARLVKYYPSPVVHSPQSTPPISSSLWLEGVGSRSHHRGPQMGHHKWVRHFSSHYKQHLRSGHTTVEPSTPMVNLTRMEEDIPVNSEFELVCMLVFTDATTGCEIAVRKSWPLADTIWLSQSEQAVKWKNIIHRDDKSDKYFVDVTGLDFIDNSIESVIPGGEMPSPLIAGAMSPSENIAFRLINTMTMSARPGTSQRTSAVDLFAAIPEEKV